MCSDMVELCESLGEFEAFPSHSQNSSLRRAAKPPFDKSGVQRCPFDQFLPPGREMSTAGSVEAEMLSLGACSSSASCATVVKDGASIFAGSLPADVLRRVVHMLPPECRTIAKHVCKLLNRAVHDADAQENPTEADRGRCRKTDMSYFLQSVALMEWACNHGAQMSEQTFACAASVGNIDVLQCLFDRGCPWDWTAAAAAADAGHLPAVKWLQYHGAPVGSWTCNAAAAGGHLETLHWLAFEAGIQLSPEACSSAAGNGHTQVLEWLADRGIEPPIDACVAACGAGHIDPLAWLHKHGLPLHSDCLIAAARGGHLEILEWLKHEEVPWTEWACSAAAASGHLTILQWLRRQGCPWGSSTCEVAARCGNEHILDWARSNGCPCHGATASLRSSQQVDPQNDALVPAANI